MQFTSFVKSIRDIMRRDPGISGDVHRIEQLSWMIFLKIYDAAETNWELESDDYQSLLEPHLLRWRDWADFASDNVATGDDLLDFVNNDLLPRLKNLPVPPNTPKGQALIKTVFSDVHNYMKDGVAFREVLELIDQIDFTDPKDTHTFGTIYENLLRELQNAGDSGEFYTPRALTDFMAEHVQLKLGDQIADLACGTGGFLNSARRVLYPQLETAEDSERFGRSFHGIEKKPLPYLLCLTNLLLNGIDNPDILYANSLTIKNCVDYTDKECFDVILMNPPYGGKEKADVQEKFLPGERSSETADLFMLLIEKRLKKQGGRAAVVLPDGFLFGGGNKTVIKKKIMDKANLHTIVRLPKSVFAPYTSIATNILFFDRSAPKTEQTWFYRVDMPQAYKNFSKTKPLKREHLKELDQWWDHRQELQDEDGNYKAKCYTRSELEELDYNLDQCGYPKEQQDKLLPPDELIADYQEKRARHMEQIDATLSQIMVMLGQAQS